MYAKLFDKGFKQNFTPKDLTYGDHPWASQRLIGALSNFINE